MERTIQNKANIAEKSEGEAQISIISQPDGIVVNFGKPMTWIGMPPQGAADFASLIIKHALDTAEMMGISLSLNLDARINLSAVQ